MRKKIKTVLEKITQCYQWLDKELLGHKTRKWWVIGMCISLGLLLPVLYNILYKFAYSSKLREILWYALIIRGNKFGDRLPYSITIVISLLLLQKQCKLPYRKFTLSVVAIVISYIIRSQDSYLESIYNSVILAVIIPIVWFFVRKYLIKKTALSHSILTFKVLFYPSFEEKRQEYTNIALQKAKNYWTQYKNKFNTDKYLVKHNCSITHKRNII